MTDQRRKIAFELSQATTVHVFVLIDFIQHFLCFHRIYNVIIHFCNLAVFRIIIIMIENRTAYRNQIIQKRFYHYHQKIKSHGDTRHHQCFLPRLACKNHIYNARRHIDIDKGRQRIKNRMNDIQKNQAFAKRFNVLRRFPKYFDICDKSFHALTSSL